LRVETACLFTRLSTLLLLLLPPIGVEVLSSPQEQGAQKTHTNYSF
jgi:hypothetical protein